MKLGSFELNLFGFLHEEIKNSRFLLTMMAFFILIFTYGTQFYLALNNISIPETFQSLTTTLTQAEIGFCLMTLTFYFKDRAAQTESELNQGPTE